MKSNVVDGYRYFFPVGWILGLWGVVLWILFSANLITYPGLIHPEIMMGGFFLCFAAGFLMTAAPRFTSSFGPQKWEQNLAFLLIVNLLISLGFPGKTYFYIADLLLFLFLVQFLFRRFQKRQANPPDAFIFIGVGLFMGVSGNVILLSGQFWDVPPPIYNLGRLFFLQAYILSLVMGVGSRLVPALLGWAPLPLEGFVKPHLKTFLSLAALFVASYFLEVFVHAQAGNILRALVMSAIGFLFWRLHKLPQRKERHAFWLWVAGLFLVVGQWGVVVFPDYRIHILHVVFVSGLALMTLMIATRVCLAHGDHNRDLEKSSKALLFGALLVIFAGLTRLSAGFAPKIYQSHLTYASYTWLLALLVWGGVFVPKILLAKTSSDDRNA